MKGQNARSGGGVLPAFGGVQTPIFRKIPRVGFTNINTKEYIIFNMVSINLMQY
jgi:large subunit ribosomal protein L15